MLYNKQRCALGNRQGNWLLLCIEWNEVCVCAHHSQDTNQNSSVVRFFFFLFLSAIVILLAYLWTFEQSKSSQLLHRIQLKFIRPRLFLLQLIELVSVGTGGLLQLKFKSIPAAPSQTFQIVLLLAGLMAFLTTTYCPWCIFITVDSYIATLTLTGCSKK